MNIQKYRMYNPSKTSKYNQESLTPDRIVIIQVFMGGNGSVSAVNTSISVFYTFWTGLNTLCFYNFIFSLFLSCKSSIHWSSNTRDGQSAYSDSGKKATSSDTPDQNQAIKGPYANGYWDDMAKEVDSNSQRGLSGEQWMKRNSKYLGLQSSEATRYIIA